MVKVTLTDEQIPLLMKCLSGGINDNLTLIEECRENHEDIAEDCEALHRQYAQLYTNLSYQIECYEEED